MKKSRRVSEPVPVQVYLAGSDRERLERLAAQLALSKSEVLRRGLAALETDVVAEHPLLELSGIGEGDQGPDVDYDVAIHHDRYLAEYFERQMDEGRRRLRRPKRGRQARDRG